MAAEDMAGRWRRKCADLRRVLFVGERPSVMDISNLEGLRLFAIDFARSGVVIQPLPQSSSPCDIDGSMSAGDVGVQN